MFIFVARILVTQPNPTHCICIGSPQIRCICSGYKPNPLHLQRVPTNPLHLQQVQTQTAAFASVPPKPAASAAGPNPTLLNLQQSPKNLLHLEQVQTQPASFAVSSPQSAEGPKACCFRSQFPKINQSTVLTHPFVGLASDPPHPRILLLRIMTDEPMEAHKQTTLLCFCSILFDGYYTPRHIFFNGILYCFLFSDIGNKNKMDRTRGNCFIYTSTATLRQTTTQL